MASESTVDTFGTEQRDRIAKEYATYLMDQSIPEVHDDLNWILRDGFTGLRHMKDSEVWHIANTVGYFNEDAGEDR